MFCPIGFLPHSRASYKERSSRARIGTFAVITAFALTLHGGITAAQPAGPASPRTGPAATAGELPDAQVQGAPPSPVLPPLLTLTEALRIFRAQGLDLLIAEAAVKRAAGDNEAAAAVANPNFMVTAGPSFNYSPAAPCSGCSSLTVNLGASDNGALFDSIFGKRSLRMRSAQAALAAARLGRADAQRKLEYQLKQQYLQIVIDVASIEVARQLQASMTQTLELTRKRYMKTINEADLARVEIQKLEADQAVTQATMAWRQDQVALAFLLGVRGMAPDFAVEKTLLGFYVPAELSQATEAALLDHAVQVRPDLKGAELQRVRAELALRLARRQRVPDVQLSLQYNMMGSGQKAAGPPYLAPELSLNLPIFYQQQGEITRAQADLQTQSLQHDKTLAQVVSDIEKAYSSFDTARRQVERMQSRILDRARVARDILDRQYKAGSVTLIDFLDAQRTYLAANIEYLTDLTAYWTAVLGLEQAAGAEYLR
jgi:cobalt-zinc-cadmium efflux system outer membrane protein